MIARLEIVEARLAVIESRLAKVERDITNGNKFNRRPSVDETYDDETDDESAHSISSSECVSSVPASLCPKQRQHKNNIYGRYGPMSTNGTII